MPSGDAEELRRRSQREAEERQRQQQAPDVRLPRQAPALDPDALDLPDEKTCFTLRQIQLEGSQQGPFAWTEAWLAHYTGRCVGKDGIELILRRLSARLIAQGYVTTRINLPAQDLASGILRLQLVPGRVRAIRFADSAAALSWRAAFPMRPGDLLNLRDIEQALEQLKRVPSQDANIDIVPGDREGESDLVVTLKQGKPWRIGLTVDDAGSKATGKWQGSLSFSLDNPLNLNDLLSLSFNNDLWNDPHRRGTRGYGLNYSIPWGDWTLQLSDNFSHYRQTIQGQNQTFQSSGDSRTQELRLQRLLYRDRSAKTSLQLRTQIRSARSYIENVEIAVQRRRTAAFEFGALHRQYFGDAQLDLNLAHRIGVPWFNTQNDPAGLPHGSPTLRYRLNTLDTALLVPFKMAGLPLRWNSALRIQHTKDTLYSTDFLAIGNRYTVRGFDGERTLAAERGGYWRNDLEIPLGQSGQTFYLGIDYGRIGGPGSGILAGKSLTGAAIGFKGGNGGAYGNVTYDLFAGWALRKPEGFVTARPAAGVQISFQY